MKAEVSIYIYTRPLSLNSVQQQGMEERSRTIEDVRPMQPTFYDVIRKVQQTPIFRTRIVTSTFLLPFHHVADSTTEGHNVVSFSSTATKLEDRLPRNLPRLRISQPSRHSSKHLISSKERNLPPTPPPHPPPNPPKSSSASPPSCS